MFPGFQILVLALERLIEDEATEKMSNAQLVWLCSIMLSATVVKLALWLYCRTSGNTIVRAYAKVLSMTLSDLSCCDIFILISLTSTTFFPF